MSKKEYSIVRLGDNAYMHRNTGGWAYPGGQGGEIFLTEGEAKEVKKIWETWEPTEKFAIEPISV